MVAQHKALLNVAINALRCTNNINEKSKQEESLTAERCWQSLEIAGKVNANTSAFGTSVGAVNS